MTATKQNGGLPERHKAHLSMHGHPSLKMIGWCLAADC